MQYRQFGTTGLEVSPICYGTMRYASRSGQHDEHSAAATRALEEAVEAGINFIHSSYEYGTRWLTGEVLGRNPKRHDLIHVIKVNVPDWGEPRFNPQVFRSQIEDALRELRTDRIAVVQHLQRGEVPRELGYCAEGEPKRLADFDGVTSSLVEVFEKLRDEGKVGHLASFPYTVGYAERAISSSSFCGLIAYFNALETEMLDVFPAMEEARMGFIGIRPFAAGLLTDRRIDRDALPADDRFRDGQFDRFYDQLTKLRQALPDEPESWTEFAIRFSLAHPLIASTVVGINTPQQLHAVLTAVEGPVPDRSILDAAHSICSSFRQKFGVVANAGAVPVY